MIPKNITCSEILNAIHQIDQEGIPKARLSRTYSIKYNNKYYPPKYVISIANKMINGFELKSDEFGGGTETNSFLEKLGFEIVPHNEFFTANANKSVVTSSQLKIITVSLESNSDYFFNSSYKDLNKNRLILLERTLDKYSDSDVLLFPAGFFEQKLFSEEKVRKLTQKIIEILYKKSSSTVVCFGVDCRNGCDQLAVAVNKEKILAIGRKFYPTADEKNYLSSAYSFDAAELGYKRWFTKKNKKIYLAVCYDCFGIRHQNIINSGYDIILTLAHRFHKKGEGPSGDVDFARKGFAGASQQWNCPVFGTATFFDREVPPLWPTGVLWSNSQSSVKNFKYTDNGIHPIWCEKIDTNPESATCRVFLF